MEDLNKDLMNLAKMVADLIAQDQAAESFINASEEEKMKFLAAYLDEAGKRIQRIQNLWLTNPEFKEMYLNLIYDNCTK